MANVRIDVERTVRRRNSLQSESGQGIEQQLAVAAVSLDVTLQLFTGIEGNQAGVLTQGGRREVHVAAEGTCPPGMLGRSQQPAEPPTDHAEILGEAAEDEGAGLEAEHGLRGLRVGE